MRIGGFGFGLPHGVFAALGIVVEDITLCAAVPSPAADRWIEPFMDPFSASLLRRLADGRLDAYDAILFLRESPGALHACQYGLEFERRGLLTPRAPRLVLFNLIPAAGRAVSRFNRAEIERLRTELSTFGWKATATPAGRDGAATLRSLEAAQAEGRIGAAAAFEMRAGYPVAARTLRPMPEPVPRRDVQRIALLGAPLGNSRLHARLEDFGTVAIDQQGLDQARAARGSDIDSAVAAYAANPFAARQPNDSYAGAVADMLAEHRIDRAVWQVDPHDDLWGWMAPGVREAARTAGAAFSDLGFVPRWPSPAEVAAITLETDCDRK